LHPPTWPIWSFCSDEPGRSGSGWTLTRSGVSVAIAPARSISVSSPGRAASSSAASAAEGRASTSRARITEGRVSPVATRESAALAEKLIAATCAKQGITAGQLTIHADRGSSMTSKPVAFLLADLGVIQSHSRPHVSNDNPHSEAQFKTLKYRPGFPARFASIEAARAHCQAFFPGTTKNIVIQGWACTPPPISTTARPPPSRPAGPAS
jgi:hypothetical protein